MTPIAVTFIGTHGDLHGPRPGPPAAARGAGHGHRDLQAAAESPAVPCQWAGGLGHRLAGDSLDFEPVPDWESRGPAAA